MNKEQVQSRYEELCKMESDIYLHLPTLRKYADLCNHVTEFGVRGCVSLFAFLSSKSEKVVAVDILNVAVPDVEKLQFICADDLKIEIEPTDMLFIDTLHNYNHCKQELELHAHKVKKFIAFHDVFIFGEHGDDGGKGLLPAIKEFMETEWQWKIVYRTDDNNGLMVIERL